MGGSPRSRNPFAVGTPVSFLEDIGRSTTRLFGRVRKVRTDGQYHAYTVDLVGGGVKANVPIVTRCTDDELSQAAAEVAARPPVRTSKDAYAEYSTITLISSSSKCERSSTEQRSSSQSRLS